VLSDSGTVQEECCLFHVPNVTVRDVTERPETLECGSNMLAGAEPRTILDAVKVVLGSNRNWNPPAEYLEPHVSTAVIKIVLGYDHRHGCGSRTTRCQDDAPAISKKAGDRSP
jgi:UDP-N-acetylglucosamine 2-epimerase (non-hydrolysing)